MERAVRRPVPAIRAATSSESTAGSDKYQPGGHVGAASLNPTAVPHPQGSPDQRGHCAGSGVPRALGLRATGFTSNDCHKESDAGTPDDAYNASGQTDANCTEDSHSCHHHCYPASNASERLGSFGAIAAATRVDGSRSFNG